MQTKRRVSFSENISDVKCYEYSKDEENEEKMGKDWQKTRDLTCREFFISIEKGGCGRKWSILQQKLDNLSEPCWRMIGQLWNRLFPNRKRLEEEEEEEEKEKEEIKRDNERDNERDIENNAIVMYDDSSDDSKPDDDSRADNCIFSYCAN
jgi:hypothetical protein